MRSPARTVCFSAWFLMGTRLMQSFCLCVCVYILLPSPITFGLIAQFLQGGRGSRGASGAAGIFKSVEESEATGIHCSKAGVVQPGEQCRVGAMAQPWCCWWIQNILLLLLTLTLMNLSSLISYFAIFSVEQGEFERFC